MEECYMWRLIKFKQSRRFLTGLSSLWILAQTVYVGLLIACSLGFAVADDETVTSPTDIFSDKLQGYLSQFGYLPRGDPRTRNSRREKDIRKALRNLQKFAGISETGELDTDTRSLLIAKRCGIPDTGRIKPKESSPQGYSAYRGRFKRYVSKWHHEHIKYKISSYPGRMGPGRVRRAIYDAMQVWNGASSLHFQETSEQSPADIVVDFHIGKHGDGYPFDGPDVVLAHAFFPGGGAGGDIHFDGSEAWTDNQDADTKQVHLFSVAAHEIGHSLGLAHTPNRDSLMYPYYYKHDPKKYRLPYYDVIKLQNLYGAGRNTVPLPPPTTTTTTTTTISVTTPRSTTKGTTPPLPDTCNARPDAVTKIRNEIAVFQGSYFWRLDERGYLLEQPLRIGRFWYGLPDDTDHIDAIYEKPGRDRIVFFIGQKYWEFATNFPMPGYPRPLTKLGLPERVKKLDAAFVWGYNGRTYFFAGSEYWRFDERLNKTEPDYPRDTKVWKGIPTDISAALTDHQENTYFFKDDNVYKFHGWFMKVEKGWPKKMNEYWTACKPPEQRVIKPRSISDADMQLIVSDNGSMPRICLVLLMIVILHLLWLS